MFEKIGTLAAVIAFVILLNFEFRAVKEFEKTHFGWYCFLSFDINRQSQKNSEGYFDREFSNIFISSEQIDEIRNQITDILEREDETNETESADNTDFNDPASEF